LEQEQTKSLLLKTTSYNQQSSQQHTEDDKHVRYAVNTYGLLLLMIGLGVLG